MSSNCHKTSLHIGCLCFAIIFELLSSSTLFAGNCSVLKKNFVKDCAEIAASATCGTSANKFDNDLDGLGRININYLDEHLKIYHIDDDGVEQTPIGSSLRSEFDKVHDQTIEKQFFTTTIRQRPDGTYDVSLWASTSDRKVVDTYPFANRNGGHLQMAKNIYTNSELPSYEGRWFGGGVSLNEDGSIDEVFFKSRFNGIDATTGDDKLLQGEAKEMFESVMELLFKKGFLGDIKTPSSSSNPPGGGGGGGLDP